MRRTFAALALLGLVPGLSSALEIKNVRPSYGPLGAPRTGTKFLPGDVLWINYDIEGLKFDDKTGKASYETKLEFLDSKGMQLFERKTPNEVIAQLGGTSMPGDLHVVMGQNLPAGKYTIKLSVTDNLTKDTKSVTYPVEVLPKGFGFVGVMAPTVGFPGQHYLAEFGLVGFELDKKGLPNVEVTIRVLDSAQKPVTQPVKISLPNDIPQGVDVQKLQMVPLSYPLYLNRAGTFTIEIVANDKLSKKTTELRSPLHVLDLGSITGTGK
jgi:hypothetical protein